MKNLYFALLLGGLGIIVLSSYSGDNSKYPNGSPGGYTGSPGDAKNCVLCHGGSAVPVTGWITSNVPVTGYTAGNTYTITVTLTGSGKKGFEVSPQTLTGALVGSLTIGTGTKLVNSAKAITHTAGSNAATATWNFTWTAPVAGTGPVTFYGAFTVGKINTKLSTTEIPESTTGITELSENEFAIFPNPSSGVCEIHYFVTTPGNVSMNVFDLTGKLVKVIEYMPESVGNQVYKMSTEDIKAGIYLLKFVSGSEMKTGKLIISR